MIPRLMAEHDYIQMVLTEREREDIFRFKRVKQAHARSKGARVDGLKRRKENG